MKNILVLAAGGDSDQAVFATALGLAQPLGAHLEFLHIQVGPSEAVFPRSSPSPHRRASFRRVYEANRNTVRTFGQ